MRKPVSPITPSGLPAAQASANYVAGKSCKTCPGTNVFGGNTRAAYNANLRPLVEKGAIDVTKEEVQALLDEQRKVFEEQINAMTTTLRAEIQTAKNSIYENIQLSFPVMVKNAYDNLNPLYTSLLDVPG